jgi:hypothetical protein
MRRLLSIFTGLGLMWCKTFHSGHHTSGHGPFIWCRRCHRRFRTPWAQAELDLTARAMAKHSDFAEQGKGQIA